METLKQEAISAISKMPDSADIDEIMYRLYVIDKVKKGKEAIERGETVAIEELKKEIESW
jgi:predicted transcriptional regulator